jgi:hypothetical protein
MERRVMLPARGWVVARRVAMGCAETGRLGSRWFLIPATGGESWTRRRRGVKLYQGCKREELSGVGDDAFAELCPKDSGPTVYAKAGAYDVVVQLKVVAPATAASVKPTAVAVAKAAVAKLQ